MQKIKIITSIFALVLVVSGAATYAAYLQTRSVSTKPVKLFGPSDLIIGSPATITWKSDSTVYLAVRLSLCKSVSSSSCVVLAQNTANTGSAKVFVPKDLQEGKMYLKIEPLNNDVPVSKYKNFMPVTVKGNSTPPSGSTKPPTCPPGKSPVPVATTHSIPPSITWDCVSVGKSKVK